MSFKANGGLDGVRGRKTKAGRKIRKLVLGVFFTILSFFAALALLNLGLGWPSSWLTLGGMLIIAWFAGIIAGERIATLRVSAVTSCVLVILIALGSIGFGQPWNLGLGQKEKEETVKFYWKASFAYLGSEDSAPLENVGIFFPLPNVENDIFASPITVPPTWTLYYQDEEGNWHVQATHLRQYTLMGERAKSGKTVKILDQGWQPTYAGPKLRFDLDNFFPREIFEVASWVLTDPENADRVTLRDYRDPQGRSSGLWDLNSEKRIDFKFLASLFRATGEDLENMQLVEAFSLTFENGRRGGYHLYPTRSKGT